MPAMTTAGSEDKATAPGQSNFRLVVRMARFIGPVNAVVYGGIGALIVTGLWARLFPALRTADRLE